MCRAFGLQVHRDQGSREAGDEWASSIEANDRVGDSGGVITERIVRDSLLLRLLTCT